ncbi:MAG: DUF802 domain-containing protein [Betaproteobacteria bacterium]
MNAFLRTAAFAAGLAVLGWVGLGYVGANPLALAVTLLIAAFYFMGALELQRFRQATAELAQAIAELSDPLPALGPWLARVPAALRNAVRRRIEGEPVGLPGPALAPYLAGLLVLLGMLGTFVGMVLTLRGTGLALESTTDIAAVRSSLIAPVKGLGLAFGTSVAGVATSAALGLLSALCRRERVAAAQALDAHIATTLRVHSPVHQREQSLALLQRQAELMPQLVDSLRTITETMALQAQESHARLLAGQQESHAALLAGQQGFHGQAEAAYVALATSVGQSLRESLADSARIAGEQIRPVAEATLAGIARETAALHATLSIVTQAQADTLASRFEAISADVAGTWQAALARHEQASTGLTQGLADALARATAASASRSAMLLDAVTRRHADWQAEIATTMQGLARQTASTHEAITAAVTTQLDGVSARLDGTVQRVTDGWHDALGQHARASEQAARHTEQALATAAGAFGEHAAGLLRTVDAAHADLRTAAATQDERRLAAMTQSLEAMAASLRQEWQQAGALTLEQQQRICDAMERSARDITAQAQGHAKATIAEIGRLVEAAAEAPRAAAQAIGELRQKLSDSMARDNSLLDERARILETLGTLLDGVNQAAGEQRGAIDSLVASSAVLLDRVGTRFGEQVEAETGKLAAVAAQVTGSAAEVASLGEAFGFGVQLFSESNDKLVAQLERIDGALGKSLARSDEQLEYYVAQAREVIDLSILSQKQIIEDLQRLAGRPAPAAALAS